MLGALAATQPRRRRFADGGDTTDPSLLGSDGLPILPPIPPGSGGALSAAGTQPPPDTGALSAAGLPQAVSARGALPAASAATAQKQAQMAAMNKAQVNLATRNTLLASGAAAPNSPTINAIDQATGQPAPQGALQMAAQPPQQPNRTFSPPMPQDSGWNVPMMAMAGAMLQPTRTGGFAESLGNALTVGAAETQKQREMLENEALRQQQMEDNRIWRQNQAINTAARNDYYGQGVVNRHEDNQDRIAAQSAAANARIAAALEKNAAGKYTYQAATQPDPNDPTKTVSGFVRLPVTGDEAPQFIPLNTTTAAQQNAGTAAGRAESIAKWRADLASRATTKAEQDRIKEMTDEQIRLMVAGQNAGTPITPDAAKTTVQQLRANAGAPASQPAAGAPAAPAAPAAPKVEEPKPPAGAPPGARWSGAYKGWFVQGPDGKWAQWNAP